MASLITGEKARMYALAGVMRAGASRAGYTSPSVFVTIAGVHVATGRDVAAQKILNETLSISETEGETPNTCSFEVQGFQPSDGQDVVITLGSKNNLDRLFAGLVITDAHGYVGTPANGKDTVNVIDYTWHLTRRTISQRWQTTSATVIAQAIIATCPGFTSLRVAAGLPTLDEFTVTNQTLASALKALCDRIGATFKATYGKDVQLGLVADASQTDPTTLTAASALLTEMRDFTVTRDLSPVITRQPVEGGGGTAVAACRVGETQIPVSELSWYNAGGGMVVSGPQRITYTGKTQASPTTAPSVTPLAGAGIDDGVHQWAYTFVTGSGETLPSLLSTALVMETLPSAPAISAIPTEALTGGPAAGVTVTYAVAIIKDLPALLVSGFPTGVSDLGASMAVVAAGNTWYRPTFISTADTEGRYVGLFRFDSTSTTWYLMGYIICGVGVGNPAVVIDDVYAHNHNTPYNTTFQIAPWTAYAQVNRARLTVVPIGPSGTTARKIYRTEAGLSQLKLQQTIANNTATVGANDLTADASLGATVPIADTSGLVLDAVSTTSGATASGSTTLNLVSGAAFLSTGGWAIVGGLPVRYAGKSANQLTGIPATGDGALSAAMPSGSTVTSCAVLTGIPASGAGSILYPIHAGDPVNLRVTIDDLAAQAVITALMLPAVDDGIIEGDVIQDGRISETEARARGTAQLALRSAIDVGITYQSKDLNLHAGRTQATNLPAPTSCVGTFKLQSVSIGNFQPALYPTRTAHGASRVVTLEALLRLIRAAGGA